jgi:hypothetical protein
MHGIEVKIKKYLKIFTYIYIYIYTPRFFAEPLKIVLAGKHRFKKWLTYYRNWIQPEYLTFTATAYRFLCVRAAHEC